MESQPETPYFFRSYQVFPCFTGTTSVTDQQPVVLIENLTKRYGDFVALDSLTMQVGKGQILGFIGPNGAGKTTTIRILVGLAKATSGKASIAGCDCLKESRKIKRIVGYMPDDFGKYNNMRVSEYLDFFGAAYGIGRSQRIRRVDEVLDIAGATHMSDLFVDALSRGMQQRVAIARTLIHDPQMIILDEPANGLDPQARIDMRGILLRLAELGKTLIVTSHILPELARVCDLVAMITKGKLRAFGTVDEIMRGITQRRTFEVFLLNSESVDQVAQTVGQWLKENDNRRSTGPSDESAASKQETVADQEIVADRAQSLVRFETGLSDAELSALLNQLVRDGTPVAQFRELATDLEDAFLSVAGASEVSETS
jgi:ABC-2 type transport system ATP-binding protein